MRNVLCFLTTLMLFGGCRKTADIRSSFDPAIDNAIAFQGLAAHAFLPTAEVLRDWGNSRSTVPFLLLTDSGIWFDYKAGVVCSDGLTRRGRCLIKNGFSLNGFHDTCSFTALPSDSFVVFGNKGPVYFTGQLTLWTSSAYSIEIVGTAEIKTQVNSYPFDVNGTIQLDPQGQTTRSAKLKVDWDADFTLTGQDLYHYNVIRSQDCFPCFSTGNGSDKSQHFQINFNPFSNAACDPVVKFTSGRDEWLEDLW
ncbi:MAG: hypothetical protein RIT07_1643 [Bacteroidota bacterium]